jgi:hypothetical protein
VLGKWGELIIRITIIVALGLSILTVIQFTAAHNHHEDKMNSQPLPYLKEFHPQPDITAWELAIILKSVTPSTGIGLIVFARAQWDSLDEKVTRHFTDRTLPESLK